MKVIAIGDTHGQKKWVDIVEANPTDIRKYIFIGDYFDTHTTKTAHEQMENFRNIIAFKELYPQEVVLLIGNHDFHYLEVAGEHYSGFQHHHMEMIQEMLDKAIAQGYMRMAAEYDGVLYTHAGVTKCWYRNNCDPELLMPYDDEINDLFLKKPEAFRFTPGYTNSNHGDDITQGPLWVRPRSLAEDELGDVKQVVGHTRQDFINITGNLAFIDTIETSGEYLEVNDGIFKPVKLG